MHAKNLILLASLVLSLNTSCFTLLSTKTPSQQARLIRATDICITLNQTGTSGKKSVRALDQPHDLNAYSAVHALYTGLILPLELVEEMSLAAKYRLIRAMWSEKTGTIQIKGYFEEKDAPLLIKTDFHTEFPPLLEWKSNAIYSPITKAPLRGCGAFLDPDNSSEAMVNVTGTILLIDTRAVRLCELFSKAREQQLKAEEARLHLAHLYLHDGRISNDHLIQTLLDDCARADTASGAQAAAIAMSQIQFNLYRSHYAAAEGRLRALIQRKSELSPALRSLLRFTFEEYCLCRALDSQNSAYLIEYRQFSRGEKP